MKKIFAIKFVSGKPTTLHIFEGKDGLISYAANNGRGEATEDKPTIVKLLNALGMTKIHASELKKYKNLSSLYHY